MSNIGKRFAKPVVWEQPHFTHLDLKQRLFWLFLNNRCDLAGVYQLHFPVDTAYLGFTIDQGFVDSFTEAINSDSKRLEILKGRRLWLLDFVRYQQTGKNRKSLSSKCDAHISVVNKMKEHDLLADAIDRDPELYSEFRDEVGYSYPKARLAVDNGEGNEKTASTGSNYPKATLSLGTRKGYSSSNSSSNGHSSNNGIATNSIKASNVENKKNTNEQLEERPSLYFHSIAKRLQEIIPDDALHGISSEILESDIKTFHDTLEADGVKDPRAFIIARAKSTNWTGMRWDDFDGVLFESATPF